MSSVMKIESLVEDIYEVLKTNQAAEGVDVEKVIDDFGEAMKNILKNQVLTKHEDKRTLRMSNIGKQELYLWYLHNGYEAEKMTSQTLMKFLYGHATEELVLALAELSGHTVTNKQGKAEVEGIKGSMDCVIDGVLIDVKTASPFGFKKFKEGSVRSDDPFGYLDQLRGYAESLGKDEGGWLVIDKTNGALCTNIESFKYDDDIKDRIKYLKCMVEDNISPEKCFAPVPDGKSGNLKLAMQCSYCVYKRHCYPEVKVFSYSTGPRFLTKIVNYPKVNEIYDYFDEK